MKTWLSKYRLSNALDAREALAPARREELLGSPRVRQFERTLVALDGALKNASPRPEAPPGLHASIMRAVRNADAPEPVRARTVLRRWLPAPAFALLLVAWWVFSHQSTPSGSSAESRVMSDAASALELGETITYSAPQAMLLPLSDEWENLSRDLDRTTEFLLASLP
jgi:hypothetical protein